MKVREVIRLLEQAGWHEERPKGGHRQFKREGERYTYRTGIGRKGSGTRHVERKLKAGAETKMKRYSVVLEKATTGYFAYSPDVPGCITVSDTEEDT